MIYLRPVAGVVVAFGCCWLPIGVIDTIDVVHGDATLPRQLYLMYGLFIFLSSTINPFIYGILNTNFRREFIKVIFGKFTFRKAVRLQVRESANEKLEVSTDTTDDRSKNITKRKAWK